MEGLFVWCIAFVKLNWCNDWCMVLNWCCALGWYKAAGAVP